MCQSKRLLCNNGDAVKYLLTAQPQTANNPEHTRDSKNSIRSSKQSKNKPMPAFFLNGGNDSK